MNKVILIGRLTRDPDFRQTQSGVPACKFTIAVDRKYKSQDGEKQSDFINIQAWRNTAEFVSRYFTKGNKIVVEGSLQNQNWTDEDGNKHYDYVVVAESVEFGESKHSDNKPQTDTPHFDSVPTSGNVQHPAPDILEFEEILSDGDVPF